MTITVAMSLRVVRLDRVNVRPLRTPQQQQRRPDDPNWPIGLWPLLLLMAGDRPVWTGDRREAEDDGGGGGRGGHLGGGAGRFDGR